MESQLLSAYRTFIKTEPFMMVIRPIYFRKASNPHAPHILVFYASYTLSGLK